MHEKKFPIDPRIRKIPNRRTMIVSEETGWWWYFNGNSGRVHFSSYQTDWDDATCRREAKHQPF